MCRAFAPEFAFEIGGECAPGAVGAFVFDPTGPVALAGRDEDVLRVGRDCVRKRAGVVDVESGHGRTGAG